MYDYEDVAASEAMGYLDAISELESLESYDEFRSPRYTGYYQDQQLDSYREYLKAYKDFKKDN